MRRGVEPSTQVARGVAEDEGAELFSVDGAVGGEDAFAVAAAEGSDDAAVAPGALREEEEEEVIEVGVVEVEFFFPAEEVEGRLFKSLFFLSSSFLTFATASLAITSQSMTQTPSSTSLATTVDLPEAMLPLRPQRRIEFFSSSLLVSSEIEAGGKKKCSRPITNLSKGKQK